jgi:hypothetical protein
MRRVVRKLLSEPLFHFVILGAALFAIDRAISPDAPAGGAPAAATAAEVERRIVVDDAVRAALAEGFAKQEGRRPTSEELAGLVRSWIERQILYREGVMRGLEQDDPRIEQRVADKMAFVLRSQAVVEEPSEEALERYYREHAADYREEELVDFVHVFVDGDGEAAATRAAQILAELQAGAQPGGLGDTFSGGRRYRQRKIADLARAFGDAFAAGIAVQETGTWRLHGSRHGIHVVRVERRTAARDSDWKRARPQVLHDYQVAARARAVDEAMAALRAQWEVVQE